MICPKCGVENADESNLCISCAWDLIGFSNDPTETVKTCRFATAAIVLAILSPFTLFLTALPAIVLGIVAIVKIDKSNGQLKGKGRSIMALVIPILLLIILLPPVLKVHSLAKHLVCGTKLKSLSCAISTYSFDYDDEYPTGHKWCDLLIDHADVELKTFRCGMFASEDFCYGLNKNLVSLKDKDIPRDIVMLFEIEGGKNVAGGPELLYTGRHNDHGCNIVYTDGYVEWVDAKDFYDLKWTIEAED